MAKFVQTPGGYSEAELREMIKKMHDVTSVFYPLATQTGCHAFIEFCGLMNEFIKVCESSLAEGIDFAFANTHNEKSLSIQPWQAAYLAEKLDCIYGPTLRSNPELIKSFLGPVAQLEEHLE